MLLLLDPIDLDLEIGAAHLHRDIDVAIPRCLGQGVLDAHHIEEIVGLHCLVALD